MRILKVNKDLTNKLFLDIDRHLSSISKRNISYVLNAYSDELAVIDLFVNGKKGTMQQNLVLKYNSKTVSWELHTNIDSFELVGLNEISTVCKHIISRMYATIHKF